MNLRELLGRNFSINQEIRKRYDRLQEYFIFRNRDAKNLFMICVALGFKKGIMKKIDNPVGLLNTDSFTDDDLWMIASVAVKDTGDINVLTKPPEIRRIAQEYSLTGLDELEQLAAEYGTGQNLELALEKLSRDAIDKLKK